MEKNREIEVRFREIDPVRIKAVLVELGFSDKGEDFFTEIIFYDKGLEWVKDRKITTQYVRLRKTKHGIRLTYKKQRQDVETAEATEIEFTVSDIEAAKEFLETLGLIACRTQEKKRHSFSKGEVMVDIDTWPQVPTYLEIEGSSEELLMETADSLGLDWKNVTWENAGNLIEKYYGLEVSKMKYYCFDKIEYNK